LLSFSAQTDNCKGSDYFKYVVTDTDSGGVEFSASTKNDVDFSEVLSPANYSVYFEANDLSKKNVKCQVTLSDVILSTPVSGSGGGSGDSGTSSAGIQSWYGLKVAGAVSATRDNLKQRTLETAQAVGTDYNARIVSAVTQGDMSGFSGWYIDFDLESAPGERMVFPNQIRHNAEKSLIGTTVIPSDGYCSSSLDGFVMAIDPFTGGRLNDTYFDYNGDSTLSDGDLLTYTDAEGNEVQIKGSGISFKDATSKPIFIKDKMISQLTDNSIKVVTVQGPGNGEGNAEILYWREVR
jgi:type IV pilus assembly protein PilY1